MRLPPLNAVRAFAVAAQHLSFKKAADELFVTPAAITYQIKSLEEFLGVSLFVRHNRAISLSAAGRRCIADVEAGFDLIERGMQKAKQAAQHGHLMVTAGPAFTIKWLAPGLEDFNTCYPHIHASVSASIHVIDLRDETVDVAIRFGDQPSDDFLFSEVLAQEYIAPMCHPRLADVIKTPQDLLRHTLIHDESLAFDKAAHGWQQWFAARGIPYEDTAEGLRFNQADHALQAAMDGNGVVMGRRILATPDVEAGRLVVLFPEYQQDTGLKHYFVCLQEKRQQQKVDAFRQWIKQRMQLQTGVNT